jgi:murein DD-endopeptidase MepM/ murein hydrolase activator NlpD
MNPFDGYTITSPYGWRIHPVHKDRRFHSGIDLVKGHKEPIYAFVAGEVVFAGMGYDGSGFGDYGNVVAVRDALGHLHCYCHLDTAVVLVGAKVERGQMIGRQGNTGTGTGSHLHYEVRKRSAPSFGWVKDAEDRCFEPTQYLVDLKTKPPTITRTIGVVVAGKKVGSGYMIDGVSYVPVRIVAESLGASVAFDGNNVSII